MKQALKKAIMLVCVLAFAAVAQADDCWAYDVLDETKILGPETQINSKDRFIIWQGDVWLNEGASIVCGGNTGGACNFIGVDRKDAAARLYVNGGTFRCSKANGSGYLRLSANQFGQNVEVFIYAGSLMVDDAIWTCTKYDTSTGTSGRGVFVIDGGEMTVGTLNEGATSDSTGSTEVYLDDGLLTVKSIPFHAYNKQVFRFRGGTLKAGAGNVFNTSTALAGKGSRELKVVANTISTFDNNGFNQMLPPLTDTGTLRLKGAGTFTFPAATITYKLDLAGTTIDLGVADGTTPCLTVGGGLSVTEPTRVNVTLPQGANGRIPIFANCGAASAAELATHLIHPQGLFVVEGTTVYLDTTISSPAELGLIYSNSAGGDDTPANSSYTFASFLPTAGAFNLNGDTALTLSGKGTVIALESAATQTVNRALVFSNASSGITTVEGSTLILKGGLTATTPFKDGPGTLVFDNAAQYPAVFNVIEGTVDLGGMTYSGNFGFLKNGMRRSVTFRNGTWRKSGDCQLPRVKVHFGEGFSLDLKDTASGRLIVGFPPTDWPVFGGDIYTGELHLEPGCGTVTLRGNTHNSCNFIGVDKSETGCLFVNGGVLHATSAGGAGGTIRIAAGNNTLTAGQLKVAGGELKVDNDLTLATVYNGTSGGAGTAEFDLESGIARIGNLYLGGSTTSAGKGTVRLTGGDLYLKMLKCWGYCTQTLLCDGATIHAVQDSTAAQPFMTVEAGADKYQRSYTIGANGLTLDTAGYATAGILPFTGTGPLTVMGGGAFVNAAAAPFAGTIAVSNDTTLAFTACRQIGTVTLAENATLQAAVVENEATTLTGTTTLARGAKIVVDVSGIECAQTSFTVANAVLPAGRGLLDVVALVDREGQMRYAPSLGADGKTIVITLVDHSIPCFAVWTGEGDPANVRDPANWECRDAVEGVLPPTTLPTDLTTIRLSGETALNVPLDQALVVKDFVVTGPVTLKADCDWRGLKTVTIPEGLTIDLRGRKLTVSDLAGSGAITDTSVEYVPLEYIESTGSQWIDTGYTHTANTRIECVINSRAPQVQSYPAVFGAFNGSYEWNAFVFFSHFAGTDGDRPALTRTGNDERGSGFFPNEKVRLVCTRDVATWTKVDDPSQTGSVTNSNCTVDAGACPLAIFNIRNMANVQANAYACMKLYSFQIWEGDVLQRDFEPRRRGSDGAAGLWDRQNGVFYPSQNGNFSGVAATNDIAYGELHLNVQEGQTLNISTLTLNGAVRVVKEGAGVLTYTKADLGYYGGMKIAAGTFKASLGNTIGAMGTPIEVDAGATFDINGKYDFTYNEFVLNGGTLTNSGTDQPGSGANLRQIRLTADSFVTSPNRLGMIGPAYSPCRLDLAGYTLTVDEKWDFFLFNTDITAGTFKMIGGESGGFLNTQYTSVRAPETIFDLDCVLSMTADVYVKDLIYRRNSIPVPRPGSPTYIAYGTAKINVYGTFTPVLDYFHNVQMLNGSTLDISAKDWDWSVTSLNKANNSGTALHRVSFADDAIVKVDFGTRHIPGDGAYAFTWGDAGKPANLDKVKFKAIGAYARSTVLKADDTGLLAMNCGMIIYVR